VPQQTEVQTLDGHWLLLRIFPYRSANKVIKGIVITFTGIDRLKRAESQARSGALAQSIVQTVREPLVVIDCKYDIIASNRAFIRLLGIADREIDGRSLFEVSAGMLEIPELRRLLDAVLTQGESVESFEFSHVFAANRATRIQLNARRLEQIEAIEVRALLVLSVVNVSGSDPPP
jgi:two-component system CheB/CheR fusion protein